jgi:hypothetical protein
MITDEIRKRTAIDSRTLDRVSNIARSALVVGVALCLGYLIFQVEGAIQREFIKALAVALGLCAIAATHKISTKS